jgi:hypothetical protein
MVIFSLVKYNIILYETKRNHCYIFFCQALRTISFYVISCNEGFSGELLPSVFIL